MLWSIPVGHYHFSALALESNHRSSYLPVWKAVENLFSEGYHKELEQEDFNIKIRYPIGQILQKEFGKVVKKLFLLLANFVFFCGIIVVI